MKNLKLINQSGKSYLNKNEMLKVRGGECCCCCNMSRRLLRKDKRARGAGSETLETV